MGTDADFSYWNVDLPYLSKGNTRDLSSMWSTALRLFSTIIRAVLLELQTCWTELTCLPALLCTARLHQIQQLTASVTKTWQQLRPNFWSDNPIELVVRFSRGWCHNDIVLFSHCSVEISPVNQSVVRRLLWLFFALYLVLMKTFLLNTVPLLERIHQRSVIPNTDF